jgi:hypothetical protein
MSTLYLLDTNILVHHVRNDRVGERLRRDYSLWLNEPRPAVSIVTAGEVRSLSFQFGWGPQKTAQARYLLTYYQRLSIDTEDVLQAYALIDTFSERAGRSMGKNISALRQRLMLLAQPFSRLTKTLITWTHSL